MDTECLSWTTPHALPKEVMLLLLIFLMTSAMRQEDLKKAISMWKAERDMLKDLIERYRADRPGYVYELEDE